MALPPADSSISDLFDAAERLKLPKLKPMPESKSLKTLKMEQEQDRIRQIEAHMERFSAGKQLKPVISDEEFMMREKAIFNAEDHACCSVFQADIDSLKIESKSVETTFSSLSPYEQLYIPKNPVKLRKEEMLMFQKATKLLDRALDMRDIKRIANAQRRMQKNDGINLRMARLSAADVKKKIEKKEFSNIFGFHELVPLTLTKTNESAEERKRKIIDRFRDFIYDFDYEKRAKSDARQIRAEEYEKLWTESEKIRQFLKDVAASKSRSRSATVPKKKETNLKTNVINNVRAWEEEYVLAEAQSEKLRKRKAEEEAARKEKMRKRQEDRELLEQREREDQERREEKKKLEDEQLAEFERKRRVERQKIEEEEKARKLQAEEERRREQARLKKEEDAAKLQAMKREIGVLKEKVDEDSRKVIREQEAAYTLNETVAKPISLQKHWHFLHCLSPKKQKEWKDKYYSHYNMLALPEHREMERAEALATMIAKSSPTVIPQENTPQTAVHPLSMPKRTEPKQKAEKSDVPAGADDVAKPSVQLQAMLEHKKLAKRMISLDTDEYDYDATSLETLETTFAYPFERADGMYWPVLHAVPNVSARSHIEALAQCHSFSGKFSSHLLLTTTPLEDDFEKKFDDDYINCDGEWADYSMKPGRFSNRIGFRAKHNQSTDSAEVQREIGVNATREAFVMENRGYEEMEKYEMEYEKNHDKETYSRHLSAHLGQLVNDARIDIYSQKMDFEFKNFRHPGTRETHLDPRWHNHGYRFYIRTRDTEFGDFMHSVCAEYEHLLPCLGEREDFEEWCLAPMLASLLFQTSESFSVFSKEQTKKLEERRRKFQSMLKSKRFVLEEFRAVCRITETDEQQWTILLDQLVSHFRDFPLVSSMMYDPECSLHKYTQEAVNEVMCNKFKARSNFWDFQS